MTIFTFALKRTLRDRTNILFLTLFPVAAIFLPDQQYWPLLPLGYQYFGVLMLFVSIRLTSIMLDDRQKGVVKRLAAAPVSHFQYLWQNLLAFAIIMFGQSAIFIYGGSFMDTSSTIHGICSYCIRCLRSHRLALVSLGTHFIGAKNRHFLCLCPSLR
ncbi:hypothetical protein [Geomicrobium sp. JCM 19037]|uniref:hypothetical protein n=1 Tax=Geomicrobium sp. JCM 19037 TaxID=1460634 RepID=UPI000A7B8E26|nr:hypothetical protein [Geomicrobium sp. JCM 19037]